VHAGAVNTYEHLSPRELRRFRGTFGLLLLAEAMIFVTVFSARFVFVGVGVASELNWTSGILVSVLLAISGWPVWSAVRLSSSAEPRRAYAWLLATFALGAIALGLIVADWVSLPVSPSSRFGGVYLLATIYHALHIVAGLIALVALASSARRGRFSSANAWSVEAGAWFWSFVIVSWLALFVVFFLV